jgi:DNA polymerase-3 subunit alpha
MPEQNPEMTLPPFIVSPTPAQTGALAAKAGSSDAPRMLSIVLRATGDKEKDVRRLKCINGALRSCPGRDKFAFHILENGRRYLLEFPNESTGISADLLFKLSKFVEEENIRIDPLIIQ